MPQDSIHQLVYVSSATRLFSPPDLLALLEQSRRNNSRVGITGMLLYREGNFMQVLEGDPAAVLETHQRIVKDLRHHGLITLKNGRVAARSFAQWSMAFRNLELADSAEIPGYSDFLNQPWNLPPAEARSDAAARLIEVFRRGMRS